MARKYQIGRRVRDMSNARRGEVPAIGLDAATRPQAVNRAERRAGERARRKAIRKGK